MKVEVTSLGMARFIECDTFNDLDGSGYLECAKDGKVVALFPKEGWTSAIVVDDETGDSK